MTELVLEVGEAIAVLDSLGGRLASLRVRGHELLAPVTGPRTQAGCYPMVPWAGRLDRGRFGFAGIEYEMEITMAPHAIHGLATAVDWDVTGPASMEIDLAPLWPLGGNAAVRYELTASGITCAASVTAGDHALPAVIGWHPCFVRSLGGHRDGLDFSPGFMWTRGDDYLPTGDTQPPPPGPWDDCFGAVTSPPRISWGSEVTVTLTAPTDTWVAFDMMETIICVEPQTDTPNAFNMGGGTVLAPGECLELPLRISWT